jgi:hypothetical protein
MDDSILATLKKWIKNIVLNHIGEKKNLQFLKKQTYFT